MSFFGSRIASTIEALVFSEIDYDIREIMVDGSVHSNLVFKR